MVVVEVVPRLIGGDGDARPTSGDELVLRFGDPAAGTTTPASASPPPVAGSTPPEGVEGVDYHVVRAGESLSRIAELAFGDATRAAEIAARNGIADPDQIAVGDVLRLR